ncbi:MAG: hypothetical protein RIR00_2095 [Pseudomonadota bacterium]|jgi:hypothetical protein
MTDLATRLDQFGHYLRAPGQHRRPAALPAAASRLYSELLFNNFRSFSDACFPLCRGVLGEARWTRLLRRFFRDGGCRTPWFREVPLELVNFVASARGSLRLPAWLPELAHYEWAELAVDTMDVALPPACRTDSLLDGVIVANPVLLNLSYAWPVPQIGPTWRPRRPQPCQVAVFRDAGDRVRFTLLNPFSARLLSQCCATAGSGRTHLLQLAGEMKLTTTTALLAAGEQELLRWQADGLILGVEP